MTVESQTERWRRLIVSTAAGRGGAAGAPITFLDDILPTLSILDPEQAEQHHVRGEQLWAIARDCTAAGGRYARLSIRNMVDSGRIVTIENVVIVSASAPMSIAGIIVPTVDVQEYSPRCLDTRGAPAGLLEISPTYSTTDQAATQGFPCSHFITLLATTVNVPLIVPGGHIVLSPGFEFNVFGTTLATQFNFWASGYTRNADPIELRGY